MTEDPIVVAARFLQSQIEWLRHASSGTEAWAPGAFREISDCAGRMRALVNGPSEQKFLGPCGAYFECNPIRCAPDCPPGCGVTPCPGDVYGIRGAQRARCRLCGAEVAQADREAWLDGEVRTRAFRASQIADAYGVSADTIRTWHARGQLAAHGTDGYDKQQRPRPTFNVGEVLDMFRALAVRRAEQQAKRARRVAERVAGGERMSA